MWPYKQTVKCRKYSKLYVQLISQIISDGDILTASCRVTANTVHRLIMELDLQGLLGLQVHSCTHWLRPRNPPPAFGRYWSAKIDDISL